MFETRAQVVKRCRIPKQLEAEVFAGMPVSRYVDHKPFYADCVADEYLKRTCGCGYWSPPSYEEVLSASDLPPLNSTASRERIWGRSKPREATNATRKEGTG